MQWKSAPPFEFEINDKTYSVIPIAEREYTEWLYWLSVFDGSEPMPGAAEEGERLLGATYAEMIADKAPAAAIRRAMLTVITDVRLGRETAEKVWDAGLTPEALAPHGANQTPTQPSMGEGTATPSRASSSGTSTRKKSQRKAKA